jgi:antitoxin Phd
MPKTNSRPQRKVRRTAPSTVTTLPKTRWQLQTAKARFSEVFRRARTEGPQWITKQDKEAVVMLPAEEYEMLTARAKQPKSFVQFLRESPLMGSGINLERELDYGRDVDL